MKAKAEILIVKNVTREGPGLLQEFIHEAGLRFDEIDLDGGDSWPDLDAYEMMMVLGGPDSANDPTSKIQEELERIHEWVSSGRPYLGICLGLQLLVKAMGGRVERNPVKEVGFFDPQGKIYEVELTAEGMQDPLFKGFQTRLPVFQLHGETVALTPEMKLLGTGRHCRNQVVRVGQAAYGFQCHFELTPGLLEEWAAEDPDLKPLDQTQLLGHFKKTEGGYRNTAREIFIRFLNQARTLKGVRR